MVYLIPKQSRSISGADWPSSASAPTAGSTGGSVSATRMSARRWYPASLAPSRSNASGSSSVILPLPVTHNTGVSNANAPGGGASTNPPGVPQLLSGDPSSHAPSHRTNRLQSSTSSPRRWTRAGMPSPMGAGSFSPISTLLTLRTSFLPPLARAARASASPGVTKSGMAKMGGSTLSTRTPR